MTSPYAKRSAEVRLGLVLCGGISLTIYINGISNEFFRCVRGRGLYGLLKDLTDSDVVVDILSGSSAGGINAILLAAALCNETEFGNTAKFLRERADLEQLLRPPASHNSVLSAEHHEKELGEALAELMNCQQRVSDERASRFDELDLFITGTDVNGRQTINVDDAGRTLQVTDHRTLFWLKHRLGRKHPFHPAALESGALPTKPPLDSKPFEAVNREALTALARITSAFPAAFEPVVVSVAGKQPPHHGSNEPALPGSVDGRLARWGQLRETTVLADGGVVDNKPFTSTLQAIFSRLSARPVTRHLMFVEPDPEEAQAQRRQGLAAPAAAPASKNPMVPGLATLVFDSLITLPRYDSIAADLKALSEHNAKLSKYQALVHASSTPGASAQAGPVPASYDEARRCFVIESWTRAMFEDGPLPPPERRPKPAAAQLAAALDGLRQVPDLLSHIDIEFPLRRLFALTYYQVETQTGGDPTRVTLRVPGSADSFQIDTALFDLLNRQIELLTIVRSHMLKDLEKWVTENSEQVYQLLDEAPEAFWKGRCEAMAALFLSLELPASYSVDVELEKRVTALELERVAKRVTPDGAAFSLTAVCRFELAVLQQAARDGAPELLAAYEAFTQLDQVAFPLEVAADLHEKDRIRLVRISPHDAQRGLGRRDGKLCGVQLANFGGFLKKSWRSNDNLWGRLDAVSELTETLLDPVRLRKAEVRTKLRELKGLDARVDELFPTSDEGARENLKQWFAQLQGPDQDHAIDRLEDTSPEGILEQLILAAQLEIVREALPGVLNDDIVGSSRQRKDAELRRDQALPYLVKGRGRKLAEYFRNSYDLPQQSLGDVPQSSLWKWGPRFAVALLQALWHARSHRASEAPPT